MWADREPAQVLAAGSCSVCWVGSTGWVVFSCVQLRSVVLRPAHANGVTYSGRPIQGSQRGIYVQSQGFLRRRLVINFTLINLLGFALLERQWLSQDMLRALF